MPERKVAAGARDNYIGFFNDDGNFLGGSPDALVAGETRGMLELLGVQEVPLTIPDPTTVPIPGDDDARLAEFDFDGDGSRAYIATFGVNDLQLDAWLLGTTLQTIAGTRVTAKDIRNAPERNCNFIHQSRAKKFNPTDKGRKAWEYTYVPLATCRPLGRQTYSGRTGAVYRLFITPQLATYQFGNVTMADVAGTEAAAQLTGTSDNPIHLVGFLGDGSLVNIPLNNVPVGVAQSQAWRSQGVALTINSVSQSPRQAVLSAAVGSGVYGQLMYQYSRK